MLKSPYQHIDTPALLVDADLMKANLQEMQEKADSFKVALRPHTKTHKMPELAQMQVALGARGITVAKLAEAEVMAENGLTDIFIANQLVGFEKMKRLIRLAREVRVKVGVDNVEQLAALDAAFATEADPIGVLVEIEVGELRCGVSEDAELRRLAKVLKSLRNVRLDGVFAHEGHVYSAPNELMAVEQAIAAQRRTLQAAEVLRQEGLECPTVSVGSTPSLLLADIIPGITEIRPGTYIFRDVGQAGVTGTFDRCAATVLATVISKPTVERVVVDVGAKGLTMQRREGGICHTVGLGAFKAQPRFRLTRVFDEHGIINEAEFAAQVNVGDKVEIIPNHICPVINLYESVYMVSQGKVLRHIPVLCRGKLT